ncbi:MAG: SMP-30/gluconolactonase/LRE family protein, partial [Lentisphaeraceae bacterium]|nr:SMP-30/gluconolactonase/LRE family protein [Lentisphaeraceae bacterium]
VTIIVDSNNKPNGILLSVDETVLYVVMSADEGLMSYKVKSPGVIAKGKVFFKTEIPAGQRKPSYGDGLACDKSGNLYVTVPSAKRLQVISPKGKLLAYINCHTVPANCCFGGTDNQYLYVTAGSEILKIKTPIKGHVFQRD